MHLSGWKAKIRLVELHLHKSRRIPLSPIVDQHIGMAAFALSLSSQLPTFSLDLW